MKMQNKWAHVISVKKEGPGELVRNGWKHEASAAVFEVISGLWTSTIITAMSVCALVWMCVCVSKHSDMI